MTASPAIVWEAALVPDDAAEPEDPAEDPADPADDPEAPEDPDDPEGPDDPDELLVTTRVSAVASTAVDEREVW